VVTANKKLISLQGVELERLAASGGGHLKYGAAVAGGIPVIPGLEQGLAGDRIERIEGILNGTCNFILSKWRRAPSTRRCWPRRRPRAMPRPIPPRTWAALTRAPSWPF
jgi:homoserine dehydrogenase